MDRVRSGCLHAGSRRGYTRNQQPGRAGTYSGVEQSMPTQRCRTPTRDHEPRGTFATTFVNNRGFHNPSAGSFSLFEVVTGDLRSVGRVGWGVLLRPFHPAGRPARRSRPDSWPQSTDDRGDRVGPRQERVQLLRADGHRYDRPWDYKGDSADILAETARLHRDRPEANHRSANHSGARAVTSTGGRS